MPTTIEVYEFKELAEKVQEELLQSALRQLPLRKDYREKATYELAKELLREHGINAEIDESENEVYLTGLSVADFTNEEWIVRADGLLCGNTSPFYGDLEIIDNIFLSSSRVCIDSSFLKSPELRQFWKDVKVKMETVRKAFTIKLNEAKKKGESAEDGELLATKEGLSRFLYTKDGIRVSKKSSKTKKRR